MLRMIFRKILYDPILQQYDMLNNYKRFFHFQTNLKINHHGFR